MDKRIFYISAIVFATCLAYKGFLLKSTIDDYSRFFGARSKSNASIKKIFSLIHEIQEDIKIKTKQKSEGLNQAIDLSELLFSYARKGDIMQAEQLPTVDSRNPFYQHDTLEVALVYAILYKQHHFVNYLTFYGARLNKFKFLFDDIFISACKNNDFISATNIILSGALFKDSTKNNMQQFFDKALKHGNARFLTILLENGLLTFIVPENCNEILKTMEKYNNSTDMEQCIQIYRLYYTKATYYKNTLLQTITQEHDNNEE